MNDIRVKWIKTGHDTHSDEKSNKIPKIYKNEPYDFSLEAKFKV